MTEFKGAVFFDIDGTLIDINKNIELPPESAAKAIARLRENGYLAGLATGRAEAYIPALGLDLNCVVSCNGAIVKANGEIIYNYIIPTEVSVEILKFLAENKLGYVIETTGGCYYSGDADKYFGWLKGTFLPISEYTELNGKPEINKICSAYTPELLEDFKRRFGSNVYVIMHRYSEFMDIGAAGVSKAAGIRAVLDKFGIAVENSYAFGDDNNDVEMLTTVGHGIAMTSHVPALNGLCEYVTGSVTENGIYNGLKHYGLI